MSDPTFRGWAVFCDDIRAEIGGKISFIGVYERDCFVHGDFPFTFPKFGIAVRYMEKRGVTTDSATMRIFLSATDREDTVIVEARLPVEEARSSPVDPSIDAAESYLAFSSNIILAPFVIPHAGILKVRVFCDEEIIKIGALRVQQAQPESPSQPQS
jgi:hypothetical protein